jgi:type II secretory pathway pseudopilin PulG
MTGPRRQKSATARARRARGFTLLEAVLAVAIAAILLGALAGVTGQSLQALALVREHAALNEDARFAMERMVAAVSGTSRLLLPLGENPATAWSESVRDVLAVTLDPGLDRDQDGFADADNDKDGLVDEDIGSDATGDGASGIVGIDDDNDGGVDESNVADDDEDEDQTGNRDEENLDWSDDDGDGAIDEDLDSDMNLDGAPGLLGIDDDEDGSTDEGDTRDDDEDGAYDEDPVDSVVFFLSGTTLVERLPNLDPSDGLDFTERPIAENVSLFRVERLAPGPNDRAVLVDITLQVASASGETVDLTTRVRVGGGP